MSLTYLQSNQFNYQDIPANALIYRSGTSGFETIQQSQGVLMSDGSTYSFGIPTAAELVSNYTGNNSLIMTENNQLVEVPSTGTSPNKLLRYIDNTWKIVDFSVEYIKPELYNPSSWQLWIADSDINVINIPKDNISTNYYGVKYNETTNQFDVINPDLFTQARTRDYYINYKDVSSFEIISSSFDIPVEYEVYMNSNRYACIFSSNLNYIRQTLDESLSIWHELLDAINNVFPSNTLDNIHSVCVFGGLYVKNVDEYTSNAEGICLVTDGVSSFQTTDPAIFRYIDRLPKVNNSVIVPVEFYAYNTEKVTFTRTPDICVYIRVFHESRTSSCQWCNNRNFVNVLVTSDN